MDPLILSNNGIGLRLAPTSTSSRSALIGSGDSLVIANVGTVDVYVSFGTVTTATATNAGYVIYAGQKEDQLVLDREADWYDAPYIAAITEAGTGAITVHRVFR